MINTTQDTYQRRLVDLCRDGHRGSPAAHEKRAAEYLMDELREMGLSPTAEPFLGCQSAAPRYLVHIAVAVAGVAFLRSFPMVACALSRKMNRTEELLHAPAPFMHVNPPASEHD